MASWSSTRPPTSETQVQLWGRTWGEFQSISILLPGFFSGYSGFPPSLKSTPSQLHLAGSAGAPRSHMDRAAPLHASDPGSDPVEPVDPGKPLYGAVN